MDTLQYRQIADSQRLPVYVYDKAMLQRVAIELLQREMPYGHTVRYAVKANPHPDVVRLFDQMGLHFDASSVYEAEKLIELGVDPTKISLSTQSLEGLNDDLINAGIQLVATSLRQLEILQENGVRELAVRINPGMGSGGSKRTTVGGPASSFGIWHEYVPNVLAVAKNHGMKITRLHTHIGSGADPAVWQEAIDQSLKIAEQLPDVVALDIGGGYKVGRVEGEATTDMRQVFDIFARALEAFAGKTGRQLHLEIEPGTYLVANAGTLLARIEDIVDTGAQGYTFLRLNTGMNDILRPSLYGAQHPITIINDAIEQGDYVVVGHNCESGDILTPAPGDPEEILPRRLNKAAIGDVIIIGGAGAYCASMRAVGYNGFPSASEIVI